MKVLIQNSLFDRDIDPFRYASSIQNLVVRLSPPYPQHHPYSCFLMCYIAGYAAAAYSLKGYGGSTELQCLPLTPEWHNNKATSPAAKTLRAAVKFSTGM